jgi:hypothetical protein
MRMAGLAPLVLLVLGTPCWGVAGQATSVVDVSVGPVLLDFWVGDTGRTPTTVAAQYTWLRSPGRPSTLTGVVRYVNEAFEPPESSIFAPDDGRGGSRGRSEMERSHFFEAGLGLRSSSDNGTAVWFGDFETGVAAINYGNADHGGMRGSTFFSFRAGSAWPAQSRLRLTLTTGVRVYPSVQHLAGHLSLGLARDL